MLQFETTQVVYLASAAFVAAMVRGFSGFGSALIYLPFAAQVLSPFQALTTLVIFDLLGPLPILRQAWRDCDPRDLRRLLAGLILGLPIGLWVLTLVAPEVFRYAVSCVALFMVAWCWACATAGRCRRRLFSAPAGCRAFCKAWQAFPDRR